MSLPVPSTGSCYNNMATTSAILDISTQSQAMDAPLIALTQRCNGDLRQVLFAFFSFLNRRTDFYLVPHPDDDDEGISSMGFAEGDAEKILLASFRQFPLRRVPKGATNAGCKVGGGIATKGSETKSVAARSLTQTEQKGNTTTGAASDDDDDDDNNDDSVAAATATPSSLPSVDQHDDSIPSNMKDVAYNEQNGLQIPVGNGGSTPRYKWTQTLEEISVLIGIPKSLHGKDLNVSITCSKLSVKSKRPLLPGQTAPHVFVEGDLVENVRADESTWTVEGGVMIVTLDKLKKQFWSTVIAGDEKIDTEFVDSRRHISDYDDATQAQLRKIIFDQTQYHKGLPSSDEIVGKRSEIPPLPAGVEYIDKDRLDAVETKK
jgi:hypothetical protein